MVLESLLDPTKAEKEPWELLFLGAIYVSFALLLSLWAFKGHTSIVMIALTAICTAPLFYGIIRYEAIKDEEIFAEKNLLKEHSKAIISFKFLFFGFVIAFLFWYSVLPANTANQIFSIQTATITDINSGSTGQVINTTTSLTNILLNNSRILIFCFLLSFFFGAGAVFILTWNASVVAVAIGTFIKNDIMSKVAPSIFTYSQTVSIGIMRYAIHGIPEIAAYFIGALAGGLVSIATIRYDYKTKTFKRTIKDSLYTLSISLVLLIIAGLIEVFITPKVF